MTDRTKITVTKLDAARRQLRTAIRLWFNDGDLVAIHTLAFAAYEIIHVVSKKRNRIKNEYRSAWNKKIKGAVGRIDFNCVIRTRREEQNFR